MNFTREEQYTYLAGQYSTSKKEARLDLKFIDFQDLNKVCPKDDFHVHHTDLLVDTITGYLYEGLTIMDGYSVITKVHPKDKKMTAFHSRKESPAIKLCYSALKV